MHFLSGKISDRIRATLKAGDASLNPPADRNDSPPKDIPTPKNSEVTRLGKADRKTKR